MSAYRIGDLEIDTNDFVVKRSGMVAPLMPRPAAVLQYLIANKDRIVSRSELIDAVWDGKAVTDAALDSTVRAIRRAFSAVESERDLIRTLYGRGWQFSGASDGECITVVPDVPPNEGGKMDCGVVAVLPFGHLTEDRACEIFTDGLVADITMYLSKFRDIRTLSHTASSNLPGHNQPPAVIGLRLGADYIVEGTIRAFGETARLVVQVTKAKTETCIWAQTYDLSVGSWSDDQRSIAKHFVGGIVTSIKEHETDAFKAKPFHELNAWQCFMRGRRYLQTFNPMVQADAVAFFERSTELAPDFADAHAGLSYALVARKKQDQTFSEMNGRDRRTRDRVRALNLAQKAITLNDRIPIAWVALSHVNFALGNVEEALVAARTAVELNPTLGWAYYALGQAYWQVNKAQEAIDAFDAGLEASPIDLYRWPTMAEKSCALILQGRHCEAIEWSRKAQVQPLACGLAFAGEICALGHLDRPHDAQQVIQRARELGPELSVAAIQYDYPFPDPSVQTLIVDGLKRAGLS